MDPLSVTASVIAVTTLAWQSCKAAYDFVDGLAEAPRAIDQSKNSLIETQKTLTALQGALKAPEHATALNSVLQTIELDGTLKSVQHVCDEFIIAIRGFTTHSTDGKLSKRDRLTVTLHESKITKFNMQLGDCQRTISMVLKSINLVITSQTSNDLGRLPDSFQIQERALAELDKKLRNQQTSTSCEEGSASNELTDVLRKACQQALSATQARRTGQRFGDMVTDDQSYAMQGIVGEAQDGVDQSFRKMTTTKNSRAFQGQMDATSFAAMFGR